MKNVRVVTAPREDTKPARQAPWPSPRIRGLQRPSCLRSRLVSGCRTKLLSCSAVLSQVGLIVKQAGFGIFTCSDRSCLRHATNQGMTKVDRSLGIWWLSTSMRQMLQASVVASNRFKNCLLAAPGASACCLGYEVNEGPVREWNKAHPSASVGPGAGFPVFLSLKLKEGKSPRRTAEDRILEVNGCRSGRL